MRTARYIASILVIGWVGVLGWGVGCSSNGDNGGDAGADGSTSSSGGSGGSGSGSGIKIGEGGGPAMGSVTSKDGTVSTSACNGKGTTTLSGRVFDPAGKNPVYAVAVYSPYSTPGPMPKTNTCNCSELYTGGFVGSYQLTDATGYFKFTAPPASVTGGTIPLVLQIGKWRTQTQVQVTCGMDNVVKDGDLRLPSRSPSTAASPTSDPTGAVAGDLPSLAISTGGADTLECLLTRIGVSENEYTPGPSTTKQIHIFQGSPVTAAPTMPGAPVSYQHLWDSVTDLSPYDAVLLSCEGQETVMPNLQALHDYATSGGRVFASHYHYVWFLGQPWPTLGTWYTTHANQLQNPTFGTIPTTLPNGVPFPAGVAMSTWLSSVNALNDGGELSIVQARHNVDISFGQQGIPWMYFDPSNSTFPPNTTNDPVGPKSVLYFSYDTMGQQGEGSCGRIVYSDLHVGGNSGDYGEGPNSSAPPAGRTDVPTGCNAQVNLSDQEKALEFMLFDLTSCLAPPGSDAGTGVTIAQ